MKRHAWLLMLAALALAGQACNIERVLDPSLPTYTPEATLAPTATATLPPTAAPTLTLEARVDEGDRLFFYGDWTGALATYQRVASESADPEIQAAARLGEARTQVAMDNQPVARSLLQDLIAQYPDSQAAAGAYYALATVYEQFDNPLAAAEAYQAYLDLRPGVIDSYVQESRGDQFMRAANYPEAIAAYQLALDAPRLGDASLVRIKIGNAQSASGDKEAAIATYQAIFDATINESLKADLDLLIGTTYADLGDTAAAYGFYQHAVNNYPTSLSAHTALVQLVTDNQTVDEYQRGFIDYNTAVATEGGACGVSSENAQELYIVAIQAFERYIQANPDLQDDSAPYYYALSLRAIGDYPAAVNEWNTLINDFAFNTHWVDAYEEKAYTQWLCQDDYEGAIDTLLTFVANTPSQPASAYFLYLAGRIAESGGRLSRSLEIWPRVFEEYPASEYAYASLFNAGLSAYRLADYARAQSLFLNANQSALSLEDQSQSLFWIGKTYQVQGDELHAIDAWQQASLIDPTGYYSERSADLLEERGIFDPPASYSFDYDVQAERQEAEDWIRSTFTLPDDTDLSSPGSLAADPRFQRGTELWNLGEYEAARSQFEDLRQSLTQDPANSYRLANYLTDLGLYRTAIFAAREVLNMVGMSDAATFNAPVYFNRIRFGAYFKDLVLTETSREGLDPLFFYSMMRQESLFEGFVTSAAGARGLLQIIPSTGEQAAALAGWPDNFTPDDLYRPVVSIRLGADYLAVQRNAYDGDMYAALAAYNAGPGNASYWMGLANGDPDLFLEVVGFSETRNHIRSIYELYDIYRNLYSTEQ